MHSLIPVLVILFRYLNELRLCSLYLYIVVEKIFDIQK